jgi:hypothetical protein
VEIYPEKVWIDLLPLQRIDTSYSAVFTFTLADGLRTQENE